MCFGTTQTIAYEAEMHYTVEALLQGKEKILEYYESARNKWKELFDGETSADVEAWSDWIGEHRSAFEDGCGGRLMAPEIMAWSAIGSLYSNQFGWRDAERERARKVVAAIDAGEGGAELKKAVKQAAAFYRLNDEESSSNPQAA